MKIAYILLVFITVNSCASTDVIPILKNRTLRIGDDGKLQYFYCAEKSWFGKCKEWKTDKYDLQDQETRLKLIHMNFRCSALGE